MDKSSNYFLKTKLIQIISASRFRECYTTNHRQFLEEDVAAYMNKYSLDEVL